MQTCTSIDCHMSFAAIGECARGRSRVMLVEDERDVRTGLRMLLGLEADLNVVGEAEDGVSALRTTLPASSVVLLTLFDGEQIRSKVLDAGARLCSKNGGAAAAARCSAQCGGQSHRGRSLRSIALRCACLSTASHLHH